jgi:hypothetical protein
MQPWWLIYRKMNVCKRWVSADIETIHLGNVVGNKT